MCVRLSDLLRIGFAVVLAVTTITALWLIFAPVRATDEN
jgi:hypothetical protein